MSRVGKQQINIPDKTTVTLDGNFVTVKGPKGELKREFKTDVIGIIVEGNLVTFLPKVDTVFSRALWGTYASHVKNMVKGVNEPYSKKLILEGVGFKSEVAGKDLKLALGFSHGVVVPIPEGVATTAEKNVLTFTGIDKEAVGAFAAKVRALKKPEPYKGKGFHYDDEVVRRKQGKKAS